MIPRFPISGAMVPTGQQLNALVDAANNPLPFVGNAVVGWTRPSLASFPVGLNLGNGVVTKDGAGGLPAYVYAPYRAGVGPVGVMQVTPAPPWCITVGMAASLAGLDSPRFLPLIMYNAGDGTSLVASWLLSDAGFGWLSVGTYDSGGNYTATFHSYIPLDYFEWFSVYHDGTDIHFYTSSEGIIFLEAASEPPSPVVAPTITHVGWGLDRTNGLDVGDQVLALLWNWVKTRSPPRGP